MFVSKNIQLLNNHVFSDFVTAKSAVEEAARADGTVLVTRSSSVGSVYMECARHSEYRDSRNIEHRKRVTSSRRCGCEVRVSIRPFSPNSSKFIVVVKECAHNHSLAGSFNVFPENRVLNESENVHFRSLVCASLTNKQIFDAMRHRFGSCSLSIQDIENLRMKMKRENLNGKSELENMIEKANELNWKVLTRVNNENLITGLLLISPSSELLIKLFGVVMIVDATYKTNINDYPLVEGVGITNTFLSYNAFYCFLIGESQEDYTWLMNGLKQLLGDEFYPNVFSTDRDFALINAINIVFPLSSLVLCICL
jgi:hypothetical protein